MNKMFYYFFFGIAFLFITQGCKDADVEIHQDREEVLLRKIGHEILLQSNDSIALVLPILKEGNQYRIQFDTDFGFQAENFAATVDSIIRNSALQKSYLVKIEACETSVVVYSYEVDFFSSIPILEELACSTRPQPKACYEVVVQFFVPEKSSPTNSWLLIVMPFILFGVGAVVFRKKKANVPIDKNKMKLGAYLYDPKKMVLIRQEKTIELTSKENELLSLLNEFVNETVNKETILNKVWGDEGDYVGRTLDVTISKLRKKLENDSSIEIKNIRGEGYQLILEE
jgi:hypothetical protein